MLGNIVGESKGLFYSTTEFLTGNSWIDGKPIYGCVFSFTTNSAQGVTVYSTNKTADSIIAVYNEFRQTVSGWNYRYVAPTTGMDFITAEIDPGNALIVASKHSNDLWNSASVKVTVFYTKP